MVKYVVIILLEYPSVILTMYMH